MAKLLTLLATVRTEAASGYVYTYDQGTTNLGTYLYTDRGLGTPHPNPVQLDSNGMLAAWVSDTSDFKLRIRNSADDTTIDEWDTVTSSAGTGADGITVGSDNADYYTAGAAETVDDALAFLARCFHNQDTSATTDDLKVMGSHASMVGRDLWEMRDDVFNVKDFGAVGDDDTNSAGTNATAFQAAIAAVTAASYPGGAIYIPGGTYRISSGLTITNADNISIFGDGPGSIIKADGFTTTIITLSGTSDGIEIGNLQIQGAAGDGTSSHIGVSIASTIGDTDGEVPVNIHNVVFSGPSDNTGLNIGVDVNGARARIVDCHFQRIYNTTEGCGVELGAGHQKCIIANNYFEMQDALGARAAYGIYESASGSHAIITSNQVEGAGVAGIHFAGGSDNVITGNSCLDGGGHGISFDNTGNSSVTGNTCNDNAGSGISIIDAAQHNTVTGNTCDANTVHGIRVEQTQDNDTVPEGIVLGGNILTGNGQSGIALLGTDECLAQGNLIVNTSDGVDNTYPAIDVDDALTARGGNNNAIIGNVVRDEASFRYTFALRIRDTTSTRILSNDFPAKSGGAAFPISYDQAGERAPNMMGNFLIQPQLTFSDYTSDHTLTLGQSGQIITNIGASGTVTITLPALSDEDTDGVHFWFLRAASALFDFTIQASGSDDFQRRDGNAGSVTLQAGTDQMFFVFARDLRWYSDQVDYTP